MGRPLKIKTSGGGTWIALQEIPDTELTHIVHEVLTEFASSTSGTGTLSVGTDTGTSIGTFTDTNSSTSSTTTVYQNLTSVSESSMVRPVEFGSTIQEASDANINSFIISTALLDSFKTIEKTASVSNNTCPSCSRNSLVMGMDFKYSTPPILSGSAKRML